MTQFKGRVPRPPPVKPVLISSNWDQGLPWQPATYEAFFKLVSFESRKAVWGCFPQNILALPSEAFFGGFQCRKVFHRFYLAFSAFQSSVTKNHTHRKCPNYPPPHLTPWAVSILLAQFPLLAGNLGRLSWLAASYQPLSPQWVQEWSELIWSLTLVSSNNMVVMRQNLQEAECRCMSSCHRLIINLLIPLPVPSLILPQPWLTRNYCRSMIILVSTNSPLCWPCHLVWNWKSKYLKIHFQKCSKVDPKMH